MKILKRIYNKIYNLYVRSSSYRYVTYLRKKGVKIGDNFQVKGKVKSVSIDETRPSLITIGDNVTINRNFTLITHDFVSGVFLHKFNDFINSSGAIVIGNNVRFGVNCMVLKGVTIGDNCFVAAGSIVTKSVPANSIVGGVPARVLCSIDEYYEKRKILCEAEAFEYARSIKERYGRNPKYTDFWEEFHLFVDKENMHLYPNLPYRRQLGYSYDIWMIKHKRKFDNFEDFLVAAGVK